MAYQVREVVDGARFKITLKGIELGKAFLNGSKSGE
jgi:hypothetical protein